MRAAAAALCMLALVPAAAAATTPSTPAYDQQGRPIQVPFTLNAEKPLLTKPRALSIFLSEPKVASWIQRYPRKSLVHEETFSSTYRDWTVMVWSGKAGEIAQGRVDDLTGAVTLAWTGPQVAWAMARGDRTAFGGRRLTSYPVWLGFCLVFLLGLADLRRPLSLRNLDLLVLLSFSVSLWFFDRGHIFASDSLAYPPLAYLLARSVWIGLRGRASGSARPVWPVWALAAVTVFAAGFRIGLNVRTSNVIDVGYSGVIGAQRIVSGQAPYGHMPVQDDLKTCAAAGREGPSSYRIQTNGRCEAADERGDTYGPVSYYAYLPGYGAYGWKGIGDHLNAARFTSILFDLLCLAGLALVGLRFGGVRLGATLAFAWAAYPFTQYVSNSNTNDAIMPAFLIWGFWLLTSPFARGAFVALAGWTKFAALLLVPLWATYPESPLQNERFANGVRWASARLGRRERSYPEYTGATEDDASRRPAQPGGSRLRSEGGSETARRPLRPKLVFAGAFVAATLLSFWVLLLEPDPLHAARVFFDRTISWQITRHSAFSIWDWGQYHAKGIPDLKVVQHVLQVLVFAGAVAVAFVPRRKSPLQLAALTAALLIGFELVVTHWFYLYLPWFFPFVAFAVLAPSAEPVTAEAPELRERETRELVPAR